MAGDKFLSYSIDVSKRGLVISKSNVSRLFINLRIFRIRIELKLKNRLILKVRVKYNTLKKPIVQGIQLVKTKKNWGGTVYPYCPCKEKTFLWDPLNLRIAKCWPNILLSNSHD